MRMLLVLILAWPALALAQPAPSSPPAPPTAMLYQGPAPSDPTRLTTELMYREIATLEKNINTQITAIIKHADDFQANLTRFPTEVDQKLVQLAKLQEEINRGIAARTNEQFSGIALQFKERDTRAEQAAAATHVEEAAAILKIGEQFSGIALQFKERDVRTEQAAIATKIAVDAALQAQEKAFAAQNLNFAASLTEVKATFGKLIENQQQLLGTNTKGLDDKIAAVKDDAGRAIAAVKDDSARAIQAVKDDATRALAAVKDAVTAADGRQHGIGESWGIIGMIGGLMIAAVSLFLTYNKARAGDEKQTPQVVYIPTPATLPTSPVTRPA